MFMISIFHAEGQCFYCLAWRFKYQKDHSKVPSSVICGAGFRCAICDRH
jgi:hypothetical protein